MKSIVFILGPNGEHTAPTLPILTNFTDYTYVRWPSGQCAIIYKKDKGIIWEYAK
jgi:hypothetical protein